MYSFISQWYEEVREKFPFKSCSCICASSKARVTSVNSLSFLRIPYSWKLFHWRLIFSDSVICKSSLPGLADNLPSTFPRSPLSPPSPSPPLAWSSCPPLPLPCCRLPQLFGHTHHPDIEILMFELKYQCWNWTPSVENYENVAMCRCSTPKLTVTTTHAQSSLASV